ncbi:MAG: hypothetical protein M0Z63_01240 [Actinomycetota bacterium]|jgi:hypothetical protein|nr:hypothetical protein [Actinomycetota bacterium]MDA8279047.1 hypothetical protein [Actinomycetota bacterium]
MMLAAGATVVVAGLGVGLGLGLTGSSHAPSHTATTPPASSGSVVGAGSPGPAGPEGVPVPQAPVLASAGSTANAQPVDGISCDRSEQTLFHVHTHLTIFVNGRARQIPAGIGIAPPRTAQQTPEGPFVSGGSCLYWLHTHAADGIVHIESPVRRAFTLGDFFAIWGQPLGPDQVGPATGTVTAYVNGTVHLGNPAAIALGAHVQIQLDVGSPLVAPETIHFPAGL